MSRLPFSGRDLHPDAPRLGPQQGRGMKCTAAAGSCHCYWRAGPIGLEVPPTSGSTIDPAPKEGAGAGFPGEHQDSERKHIL
jgi:hypothetical protein